MAVEEIVVSVIVPNYNHSQYLESRLNSIVNQCFKNFEIILLDDNSTDDSHQILKRYASHTKTSHLILNKENSGSPFEQWQKGIELAKGELIWIAESDDFCSPYFLEELVPLISGQTILAYSASKLINENSEFISLDPWASGKINKKWLQSYKNSGQEEIRKHLRYVNTIPNASAVVFRKDIFQQIKIPLNMKFAGDWYIWIELLKKGEIIYLNKPLNSFRMHRNSTRVIRELSVEKIRYQEYFKIICENSSLYGRIKYRKKYKWLLLELWNKRRIFPKGIIFQSWIPYEFKLIFKMMELSNFYIIFKQRVKSLLIF